MRLKAFSLTFVYAVALIAVAIFAFRPSSIRAFDGEAYAIKGGTVVTVTGETIKNGIVVIRNGLITAVGADITIPADARVIDATGMIVYPGLFDSYTGYGIKPTPTPAPPPTTGGDPTQMILAQMLAPQSN